ncbi:hypothetical protein C2E23DRAFT_844122 [Lenzites betulinus]|nr:hypothetical protein C2E23DRAFT_844122 [Lenzites betulinus]
MDTDEHPPARRSPSHTNALAGPSTMPGLPPLYLPPPGPPQPPPFFTSTQDLLSRFQLLSSYDKYVRPYAPPVSSLSQATSSGATEKGKGKEKDLPPRDVVASSPAAHTPGAAQDGDDDDGAREKKFKNYRHLIKGIPGKHSMKKDDYLTNLMQIPPKQKIAITPFDLRTQRDAFSVSLEGLKGWNIHALVAESSQAREDRKRRKELKKQAKAQAQGVAQPAAGMGPNTPSALPATPTATTAPIPAGATVPLRTSTPRPTVPKPPPAHQQPPQQRGRTPVGIGTPHSIPTPGSGVGGPTHAAPVQHVAATQASPPNHPSGDHLPVHPMRGVKREREHSTETGLHVNGNTLPSSQNQEGARPGLKGAKAGNAGVRPRPVKKQRLVRISDYLSRHVHVLHDQYASMRSFMVLIPGAGYQWTRACTDPATDPPRVGIMPDILVQIPTHRGRARSSGHATSQHMKNPSQMADCTFGPDLRASATIIGVPASLSSSALLTHILSFCTIHHASYVIRITYHIASYAFHRFSARLPRRPIAVAISCRAKTLPMRPRITLRVSPHLLYTCIVNPLVSRRPSTLFPLRPEEDAVWSRVAIMFGAICPYGRSLAHPAAAGSLHHS